MMDKDTKRLLRGLRSDTAMGMVGPDEFIAAITRIVGEMWDQSIIVECECGAKIHLLLRALKPEAK